MEQVRLYNVKAEACSECFINFPEKRLEVLLEMSERAGGQLSPVDPLPVEKTKTARKKKDSNSLPPLKYSLIDDMKLQITRLMGDTNVTIVIKKQKLYATMVFFINFTQIFLEVLRVAVVFEF